MDDEPTDAYSRARPNTTVAQALASRRASANSSFHLAPAGSVPHSSKSVGRSGGGRSTSRTVSFSDEPSNSRENGYRDRYEFYDPSWEEDGGRSSASSAPSMSGASSTTRQGRFARESSASSVKWHPVTVEALGSAGSRGNSPGYEGVSDGAASIASTETSSTSKKSSGKRLWRRFSLSPAHASSKSSKRSASVDSPAVVKIAANEPPDSNFMTRMAERRAAKEAARDRARMEADEAAARAAEETARAACARRATGSEHASGFRKKSARSHSLECERIAGGDYDGDGGDGDEDEALLQKSRLEPGPSDNVVTKPHKSKIAEWEERRKQGTAGSRSDTAHRYHRSQRGRGTRPGSEGGRPFDPVNGPWPTWAPPNVGASGSRGGGSHSSYRSGSSDTSSVSRGSSTSSTYSSSSYSSSVGSSSSSRRRSGWGSARSYSSASSARGSSLSGYGGTLPSPVQEVDEYSSSSSSAGDGGGSGPGGFRDRNKPKKSRSRGFNKPKPVRIRTVVAKRMPSKEPEAEIEGFKAAWNASSEASAVGAADDADGDFSPTELFKRLGIEKAIEDRTRVDVRDSGDHAKARDMLLRAGDAVADDTGDDSGRVGGGSGRIVDRRALLKRTDSTRQWTQGINLLDSREEDLEDEGKEEDGDKQDDAASSEDMELFNARTDDETPNAFSEFDAFTHGRERVALPGMTSLDDDSMGKVGERLRSPTADLEGSGVDDRSSGEISVGNAVGSGDVAAGGKGRIRRVQGSGVKTVGIGSRSSGAMTAERGSTSEWPNGNAAVIEKARADKSIWDPATPDETKTRTNRRGRLSSMTTSTVFSSPESSTSSQQQSSSSEGSSSRQGSILVSREEQKEATAAEEELPSTADPKPPRKKPERMLPWGMPKRSSSRNRSQSPSRGKAWLTQLSGKAQKGGDRQAESLQEELESRILTTIEQKKQELAAAASASAIARHLEAQSAKLMREEGQAREDTKELEAREQEFKSESVFKTKQEAMVEQEIEAEQTFKAERETSNAELEAKAEQAAKADLDPEALQETESSVQAMAELEARDEQTAAAEMEAKALPEAHAEHEAKAEQSMKLQSPKEVEEDLIGREGQSDNPFDEEDEVDADAAAAAAVAAEADAAASAAALELEEERRQKQLLHFNENDEQLVDENRRKTLQKQQAASEAAVTAAAAAREADEAAAAAAAAVAEAEAAQRAAELAEAEAKAEEMMRLEEERIREEQELKVRQAEAEAAAAALLRPRGERATESTETLQTEITSLVKTDESQQQLLQLESSERGEETEEEEAQGPAMLGSQDVSLEFEGDQDILTPGVSPEGSPPQLKQLTSQDEMATAEMAVSTAESEDEEGQNKTEEEHGSVDEQQQRYKEKAQAEEPEQLQGNGEAKSAEPPAKLAPSFLQPLFKQFERFQPWRAANTFGSSSEDDDDGEDDVPEALVDKVGGDDGSEDIGEAEGRQEAGFRYSSPGTGVLEGEAVLGEEEKLRATGNDATDGDDGSSPEVEVRSDSLEQPAIQERGEARQTGRSIEGDDPVAEPERHNVQGSSERPSMSPHMSPPSLLHLSSSPQQSLAAQPKVEPHDEHQQKEQEQEQVFVKPSPQSSPQVFVNPSPQSSPPMLEKSSPQSSPPMLDQLVQQKAYARPKLSRSLSASPIAGAKKMHERSWSDVKPHSPDRDSSEAFEQPQPQGTAAPPSVSRTEPQMRVLPPPAVIVAKRNAKRSSSMPEASRPEQAEERRLRQLPPPLLSGRQEPRSTERNGGRAQQQKQQLKEPRGGHVALSPRGLHDPLGPRALQGGMVTSNGGQRTITSQSDVNAHRKQAEMVAAAHGARDPVGQPVQHKQQQQQRPGARFERGPWSLGEAEAAKKALAALAEAKEAIEGRGGANKAEAEMGSSLMSLPEQNAMWAVLRAGITVKKCTSDSCSTRKRKLSLQKRPSDGVGLGGSLSGGGEQLSGEKTGDNEAWMVVLRSEKGKDVEHRLSNLTGVVEDSTENIVALDFEGSDATDSRINVSFPQQLPLSLFFRQVIENRKKREKITNAAKAALIALEKGASARAITAAAQDSEARRRRDADLAEIEAACEGGDIIESQPNLSLIASSHIKDALEAKEEIEHIVRGISRFDNGLTARPAVALSADEVELEARRMSDGDVRRVLSMVKIEVVCKGPREAAAFCRKLKQHPQVNAVMWEGLRLRADASGEFLSVRAFVELKKARHVVEVELQSEKMQNTMGMDYKSVEWARGLKVSGPTGGAATQPCVRFDEIPPAVQERMVKLSRQDWMGLRSVLPQLLRATGRLEEAEELLRQNACEESTTRELVASGGDSTDGELERATSAAASASAMTELASLLHDEGKLTEAEELYRSALDMRTQALGRNHPSVGLSASNLASVLRDQGRRAEATSILATALGGGGANARAQSQAQCSLPVVATTEVASSNGDASHAGNEVGIEVGIEVTTRSTASRPTPVPAVASPPVEDVMVDEKAVFRASTGSFVSSAMSPFESNSEAGAMAAEDPDDAFTVGTVTAVAAAASAASAGLHAETASVASRSASASALAAAAVKTAVEGEIRRTRLMADGGQSDGSCVGRGGFVCWEAEEKLLTVQENVEGDEEQQWEVAHSVAVASLNNLAVLLSEQGQAEQAEGFHRRAIRAREMAHGPDHPDMPVLLSNLAGTLYIQGKDTEAEPLHKRALDMREELHGSGHPAVATSLEFLARMAIKQGKTFKEMEGLITRLVDAREASLTKSNAPAVIEGRRQVGSVMSDLAIALKQQHPDQATKAFPLFRRVFLSDEKILGCYHPLVAEDVINLAEVMTALDKLPQAEELHRRALKIRQYTLGEDHPSTVASLCHLAAALRDQGKIDQCKLLQRRAHEIQTASREKARASRTEFEAKDPDWDDGIPQLLTSEEANRRFSGESGCGGIALVGRGRGERKVAGGAMNCIMLE